MWQVYTRSTSASDFLSLSYQKIMKNLKNVLDTPNRTLTNTFSYNKIVSTPSGKFPPSLFFFFAKNFGKSWVYALQTGFYRLKKNLVYSGQTR
jgi:hypothetical protein